MKHFYLSLLLVGLMLSGCNSEKGMKPDETKTHENRVRPAASGGTSAAYFSYTNSLAEPDTILGVKSDISALTQVHETFQTEDGMMGMKEKKGIVIQPKETIIFKQGGLHVMMMQLDRDLAVGDSVSVVLQLSKAGEVERKLPVVN